MAPAPPLDLPASPPHPPRPSAACTISWSTDASGADWETAANWSPSRVPNGNDDVCIDRGAANPAVTIASGDASVREFTSAERLTITGGG